MTLGATSLSREKDPVADAKCIEAALSLGPYSREESVVSDVAVELRYRVLRLWQVPLGESQRRP